MEQAATHTKAANGPAHLDRAFVASQKQRLVGERERLVSAVDRKDRENTAMAGAATGQANETEDLAQDLTLAENNRVLSGTLTEQLDAIDRALAKIDEGTYGFSDESGEPIALLRLQAAPEAVRTLDEETTWSKRSRDLT
jgi:DnaK suppressor protein